MGNSDHLLSATPVGTASFGGAVGSILLKQSTEAYGSDKVQSRVPGGDQWVVVWSKRGQKAEPGQRIECSNVSVVPYSIGDFFIKKTAKITHRLRSGRAAPMQ